MRKRHIILLSWIIMLVLTSCHNAKKPATDSRVENKQAKQQLQGIWLDDDTDMPFLMVKGDSIYYADSQNEPVYFEIRKDTLYMRGSEETRYRIDKIGNYTLSFHSLTDDIVELHKSEDPADSTAFTDKDEAIPTYTEQTKRDSIVWYDNVRYRAYVYINPSKMKVINTSYSEDGIKMDNVYYDNVMHICVYKGKDCLYSRDFTKKYFAKYVSADFLQQAIFSDMTFVGIGKKGFHYQATLCVPESSVCNVLDLYIGFDWKLSVSV